VVFPNADCLAENTCSDTVPGRAGGQPDPVKGFGYSGLAGMARDRHCTTATKGARRFCCPFVGVIHWGPSEKTWVGENQDQLRDPTPGWSAMMLPKPVPGTKQRFTAQTMPRFLYVPLGPGGWNGKVFLVCLRGVFWGVGFIEAVIGVANGWFFFFFGSFCWGWTIDQDRPFFCSDYGSKDG